MKVGKFLIEKIVVPVCECLSHAIQWFFREVIFKMCEHLGNCFKFVVDRALIPMVKFLYRVGFFEVLGYILAFILAF